MSNYFFVRVWLNSEEIASVQTSKTEITGVGKFGGATFLDAIGLGDYVEASVLSPTISYYNNILSSTMVELIPAENITSEFADSEYTGQMAYNWEDGNLYRWKGTAWQARYSDDAAKSIADESFTESIGDVVIGWDNFDDDVKNLFDEILDDIGQLTDDTVALEADVTQLQTDYTTLDGTVTANTAAIDGLEVRVTENENGITASASKITALEADVANLESDTSGNASAIQGLDVRVTSNDGDISALSSSLTSLSTTVDGNTTEINEAAQSIDGIEGKYGVTIDNNGSITGFQLLSGAGGSAFNVRADQFAVFNSSGSGGDNPFTIFTSSRVIDGVTYPAGTYISDAYIDNATIIEASIGTLKLGNNSATSGDHDQYNPSNSSGNYVPGSGMTSAFRCNSAVVSIPAGQTADIFVTAGFRHGYLEEGPDWGYQIVRFMYGVPDKILSTRKNMEARNDFPSISTSESLTNNNSSTLNVTVVVDWYGQGSNIELQDATLSLIARYR